MYACIQVRSRLYDNAYIYGVLRFPTLVLLCRLGLGRRSSWDKVNGTFLDNFETILGLKCAQTHPINPNWARKILYTVYHHQTHQIMAVSGGGGGGIIGVLGACLI